MSVELASGFAGSVAVDDPSLAQVVGRHFEIDSVAEKNFDAVATQAPCEVREHRVAVLELNCERRAGVDLTDRSKDFEGRFFDGLGLLLFSGHTRGVYTMGVTMPTETRNERAGILTVRGNPVTLVGPSLKAGDQAPEVHLSAADLSVKTLDDLTDGGKRSALLIVVPSLDTGVCSLESQKFNTRIEELPAGVKAYVVSVDLPFAMTRWGKEQGDMKLEMLSDYRDHAFGRDYGVRIKETGLLARAIVVVGADKKIAYFTIVPELTSEPNYDEAIKAAQASAK
jgi:thiol peroxidase